ncbi:hypothetical protein TGPRC2_242570 [Toxoplasma gondii TgCatPRC2]|uniref:Uncharacterized protein n=5 Tax=Toxoplasma gondii TaxID=5811 RepID=A0A151HRZ1_TOXGO|nr:hypothetical protein TGP89_242570 [Toxoplasma gondii p89]KFG60151.1 hypothetical protein TGRUB_242570 [Toxoplasma gondii RUB]KFH04927.1 hypothetical protein TGVAND_242570 [Toxoplasma gondii VAND]KYK72199.1 hypothetical protein TGPRC2_242570 [Toxoplasma gondii TgCatPRC2]PUA88397.1 hypothetical protein TGBR9_242570 [Toxoplasma gondii TgCATBr9]
MGCTQSAPGQACSCLPNSHQARKAACAAGPSLSLKKRAAAGGLFARKASQLVTHEDGDPAATMLLKNEQVDPDVLSLDGADGTLVPERELAGKQNEEDAASRRRSLRQNIIMKLNSRKISLRTFRRSSGSGETIPSSQDPESPRQTKGACVAAGGEAPRGSDNNSPCAEEASEFFKAFTSATRASLTAQSEERKHSANDGPAADGEPTTEEMRAVWCVMKANSATKVEQKIEWLHRLEWLLVRLNPMESNHPTRHALLEAKVLELCLDCLRENQDDAGLCVSALAILVHMSLNDETSMKLVSSNGLEDITLLLKKYYERCQKRELATPNAPQEGSEEKGAASDGSDPRDNGSSVGNKDANMASEKSVATANDTQVTRGEWKQIAGDPKDSEGAVTSTTVASLQADDDQLLAVELVTLVWRLIFATSLDGDEYAQKWIDVGAAEPAIDSVASDLDVFCSATYVCWVFGALRFLPLDNAELCEDFVRRRQLFRWTLKKMEMHHEEPLVLENGFAVLANYQRAQPAHAAVLSELPEVWTKCLSWLNTDCMIRVPDVVYQGLYTVGLACSYCPEACGDLRNAKGLEFADKVVEVYGGHSNADVASGASAAACGSDNGAGSPNEKHANVLQFAEGLRRLLQPVPLSATEMAAICQEPIHEADEEESDGERLAASRETEQATETPQDAALEDNACGHEPEATQKLEQPQSQTPFPVETGDNTEQAAAPVTTTTEGRSCQPQDLDEMAPLPLLQLRTRSMTPESDDGSAEKFTPELRSPPISEGSAESPEGALGMLTPGEEADPARTPQLPSGTEVKDSPTPIISIEQLPALADAGQMTKKEVASASTVAPAVRVTPVSEAETTGELSSPELSCASPDPAEDSAEQARPLR